MLNVQRQNYTIISSTKNHPRLPAVATMKNLVRIYAYWPFINKSIDYAKL